MHPAPPRAYVLPRQFKQRERLFSGLIEALAHGADPASLKVEDGTGGWKPYIGPAQPREEIAIARKITTDNAAVEPSE